MPSPSPAAEEQNTSLAAAAQGFEWRSRATWLGAPMVHIAFGSDAAGRLRTATGIIAIGQRAQGVLAIGIVATGVMAIGVVAVGLVSCGVVAVALGLALGVNAVAPVAIGLVAFGYAVAGLAPIGWRGL